MMYTAVVHWARKRLVFLALIAGFVAAACCLSPSRNIGYAQARQTTPKVAFLSGGARCEFHLKEVVVILNRIDARLERIERAYAKQNDGAE